jgi:DNA-binding response OmpR family regulator
MIEVGFYFLDESAFNGLIMTEFSKKQPNPSKSTASDIPVILLVDDNAINLKMLHQSLEGQSYKLLSARSGEDALRIAEKANPDLILLDIMMPGIDGYETCARLKANEVTRNAVIIFLTALQATKDKVRGLSLGAVDFITKPFDPDEIIARVARQLEVHHQHKILLEQNHQLADQLEKALQSSSSDFANSYQQIKSLLSSGESDRVEFKSTLRWNLKTGRSEKGIEKAWLKSVVAFLNTDGGILLVGVGDDGHILGTDADQFENDDKYLLHLNNLIQGHIGLEFSSFIRFHLVAVDEKKVLLSECQPSPSAVFLTIGKEEGFYVRVGPGSRRLSTSEALTYVKNREIGLSE